MKEIKEIFELVYVVIRVMICVALLLRNLLMKEENKNVCTPSTFLVEIN